MSRGAPHTLRRRPPASSLADQTRELRRRALRRIASSERRHLPYELVRELPRGHGLDWVTFAAFCQGFYGRQVGQQRYSNDECLAYADLVTDLLPPTRHPLYPGKDIRRPVLGVLERRVEEYSRVDAAFEPLLERYFSSVRSGDVVISAESRDTLRRKARYYADLCASRAAQTIDPVARAEFERQEFYLHALTSLGESAVTVGWLITAERIAGVDAATRFVAELFNDYPERV